MPADVPLVLALRDAHDLHQAGGKAVNLAHLLGVGFPVPDGFVATTAAFRCARAAGGAEMPPEVAGAILEAYRRIGSPRVAVRSSATAEDMAAASMAGQYETFLGVAGEKDLLDAVRRCWASLDSPRTRSYLAEHAINPADVAMAVVVQHLVPADVAGVLFTANPQTGSHEEMLAEAAWGLGQAVVSGLVQPDTLILDRATGAVKQSTVADKRVWIDPVSLQERLVAGDRRRAACLTPKDVRDLWQLGLRVMNHFGAAQDIEWAIAGGRVYLLQSRAITTLEMAEAYEQVLRDTRAALREWKALGRGDWVRHNIAETLPHPTPLAWSVVRRFMSGDGGFGAMYRRVGFEPSAEVARDGFLDLVGGRIYMDLARAPRMFFADYPFRYDPDLLRTSPDAAQGQPTLPCGSLAAQWRAGRRLRAIQARLEALAEDDDVRMDREIIPEFVAWVRQEKSRNLAALSAAAWLDLWRAREARVMDDFGPKSLLPSLIGAMALERLRAFLEEHFWDEDPAGLVNAVAVGGEADLTLRANQGLLEVASGTASLDDWLAAYGHRAPDEFDLATPRWRERPEAVRAMAAHLAGGTSPLAMHRTRAEDAAKRAAQVAARLPRAHRAEFDRRLALVRRYLRFREDGKCYLMLGYDLLRDMALEAGRRLDIGEDVFLLGSEELHDALATGFAPLHLIDQRRAARAAEVRLVLPDLITETDIATLGEPPPIEGGNRHAAFPISPGACTGPARIVRVPEDAGDLGKGYVLVCPSTDPSWTPLFVNAAGLVMECGGTLSHGAVVAREMGIPAVVLSGATRILKDGEAVTLDGRTGAVLCGDATDAARAAATEKPPPAAPGDVRIPRDLVPPPAGTKERAAGRLRNIFFLFWAAYLLAALLLPEAWLYRPSMDGLDAALWPLVAWLGRPATVAVIAAALAVLSMGGQRLLTDNRRLRVARDRAARLRREAAALPPGSPRARAMLRLAAPVGTRIMMAAFVPLAVILGPMVMSFIWLPQRVDPAAAIAAPGAAVYVTATVHGEFLRPVTLSPRRPLALDAATPASQAIRAIRPTLERQLQAWQKPGIAAGLPGEGRTAGGEVREAMIADLAEFLKGEMPPQTLSWKLRSPEDRPGRFAVDVVAAGAQPLRAWAVLGERYPPEPREDLGDGKGPVQVVRPADAASPVQRVRVTYAGTKTQGAGVFWAPFESVTGWGWDAGWLLLYIAVYLPAMLVCRWVLRIA